jgi:hypothetical protein
MRGSTWVAWFAAVAFIAAGIPATSAIAPCTGDVFVLMNTASVPTPAAPGESVIPLALHVKNVDDNHPIVLVTIWAPVGLSFATLQTAPAGWLVGSPGQNPDNGKQYLEFTGILQPSAEVNLPFRMQDSPALDAVDQFLIDVNTMPPGGEIVQQAAPVCASEVDAVLHIVAVSTVEGQRSFLPFGSLSELKATSAQVLVGVYDTALGVYVDPARVTGFLTVHPLLDGPSLDTDLILALGNGGLLPVSDTPAGPLVTGNGGVPAKAATLWDASSGRGYFATHGVAYTFSAAVRVDNGPVISGVYALSGVLNPDTAGARVGTIYTLVPPELDSDGDGFANLAELKANSSPALALSTPYTDDDLDGIPNNRDAVTVPPLTPAS